MIYIALVSRLYGMKHSEKTFLDSHNIGVRNDYFIYLFVSDRNDAPFKSCTFRMGFKPFSKFSFISTTLRP